MATPLQNRNKILALAEQRIKLLYTDAYTRAMKIAEVRNALNAAENVNFNFRAFPRAEKELNKIMGELSISIEKMTESGLNAAHKDGLSVATQRILAITASAAAKDMAAEAANANRLSQAMGTKLANEKRGGLTLSERIWKTVQTSRNELEIIIQNNLIEGKGADVASREVRQYLNDPKKLFRRVKDKETGEYHLSKAAQQYHPGQGKYRSSYMNARRLVVSEMNMATQASECAAYADNPLIAGYEIRLSNNHTVKDPRHPGKVLDLHDICDELQGKYPPTFKFTGWHPHCYTADAKVLTARGWVKFADLQDNDLCLSLTADRSLEYAPIVDRQRFEFHGDMVRFYNRSFECQVTPNHEVLYLNKCDGRFKRMAASDYTQYNGGIYRSAKNSRPDIEEAVIGGNVVNFDDFCEFMGYWLSDGSVASKRTSQIAISQQPDQKPYKDIIAVIERMGYKPKIGTQAIYLFDKVFHHYLSQFGKCNEKFIPDEIKYASKRQIDIFLNAFVKCDGHIKKPKTFVGNRGNLCVPEHGEETYYTTSERLMADLCVCLLNAEYRPSVRKQKPTIATKKDGAVVKGNYPCYIVSKCYSATTTQFSKGAVRYDGFVYDVTIGNESHAIYIMENGKCYWGSNCRCSMIPILISPEERRKLAQARAEGKTYTPKGVITDVPDNFKTWVAKNQDRIAGAKTLPFFLQDNGEMTDKGYALDEKFTDTPMPNALKVAEQRHAQRTPEQEEAIRQKWEERRNIRTEGAAALKEMEGISDVDTQAMWDALNGGNLKEITAQTGKLRAAEMQIKMLDKLENPMQVARDTSLATARTINEAVTRTLSKMPTRLEDRLAKLDYEIDWVAREGKKRYPDTWKYSQDAYKKERSLVERELKVRQIKDSVSGALSYAKTTRSKKLKDLASEFDAIISAPNIDFTKAKEVSDRLADEYNRLMAAKAPKVSVLGNETLADLKQKMGSNLPETLQNLDKAISNFKRNNPDFEKNRDSIQKEMASILQANDLGMDINGQLLESVYNNGFYNTFQSGTSDGYCGSRKTTGPIDVSHSRLGASHKMFGMGKDLKNDQLARDKYEKYGHLLDRDKTESFLHNRTWYGASQGRDSQVQVRFKRDKVLCTWTFNDSLGCTYQPSLVTDPKIESFDNVLSSSKMPKSSDTRSLHAWQKQKGTSYVELQYHGKLTIDDVESIVFADKPSKIIKPDLIDKLKAKGIELFYFDGSKVVKYL